MNPRAQLAPAKARPGTTVPTISCSDAAQLMVEASSIDVETRDGGTIEVWTIAAAGDVVHASGPRLQVWGGMQLSWRFLDEHGTPHRVEIDVVESRFKSNTRADLVLQVMALTTDRSSRAYVRYPVTGAASLTAVSCERIVDTDVLRADFRDVSLSGIALVAGDDRVRPGDRFLLRTRFMEGMIASDIRVARVSRIPGSEDVLIGAFFLDPTPKLAEIVQAVIDRFSRHRDATGRDGIRDALGIRTDEGAERRAGPPAAATFVPRLGST
jgi:hypothetical protein